MLVCNVSLLRRRAAIAADIEETTTALDAPGTGNVVFATLVDDPASVGEFVDAYLGEIMLEAASAAETWTATLSQVFAADVTETAAAADVASVASAFTPANLTGLIGWWDMSVTASLTLSGSNILGIADQSGAGNNLAPVTSAKPTYNATGFNTSKPAMMFDVNLVAGYVGKASFPMGTGNTLTCWYVGNYSGLSHFGSVDGRIMSYAAPGHSDFNAADSWCLNRTSGSNTLAQFTRNATGLQATAALTSPLRIIVTINSSGVPTIYVNGVATTGTTVAGNWATGGQFNIGQGGGSYWDGPIAECGVATGWHDATTAAALDTYLKNKWGL